MKIDRIYGLLFFFVFMIASLANNNIIQLVGTVLFLLAISFSSFEVALLLIICLVPSIAIVQVPFIGVGLIGIGSFILSIRKGYILQVPKKILLCFLIVFSITFFRIFEGNYNDVLQFLLVFSSYSLITSVITNDIIDYIEIIYSFRFGCLLMIFGMIAQFIVKGATDGRLCALNDDCNYTAAVLIVLFFISVFSFGYKLFLRNNVFYMIISLIMGGLTGSRGFILGIGVTLFFIAVRGLRKKEERKIVILAIGGIVLIVLMYFMKVRFVVNLYDNTIGRTFELRNTYQNGNFMDISSGRFFLWDYYLKNKITSLPELLFGTGFYNYYTIQNGGYGLAAHSLYISGIIGIGIVGLICVMILYFSILCNRERKRGERGFILIPISIFIVYIFLDGIFDIRLLYYMLITVSLMEVYNNEYNQHEIIC